MSLFKVIGGAVVNSLKTSFNSTPIGKAVNTVQNINRVFTNGNASDFVQFISQGRLGSELNFGATPVQSFAQTAQLSASSDTNSQDWRVRIHLPASPDYFVNSPILKPLLTSNQSLVFPTTPQILLSSMANYDTVQPVHTNYPYHVYESSRIEDITISAEFPVENEADGQYWIAAVHFLRSITKMFYGSGPLQGHPPPRVALSGYGNFVFDETPVVVKMFNLDLPNAVDYIQVPIASGVDLQSEIPEVNITASKHCYVPTLSTLNVTVTPAYSRTATKDFNLESFINGEYIGNTKPGGFI
jgi:hypothetical protein